MKDSKKSTIFSDQFSLTCGVGVAGLLGLVPDSRAVILQLEVALLFPGTRFDFPQYGADLHRLDVVIPPNTSKETNEIHLKRKDHSVYTLIFELVLIFTLGLQGYFEPLHACTFHINLHTITQKMSLTVTLLVQGVQKALSREYQSKDIKHEGKDLRRLPMEAIEWGFTPSAKKNLACYFGLSKTLLLFFTYC